MKTNEEVRERTCPRCGEVYTSLPALSREDGKTLICPDCGIREALESIGVPKDEQEQILETIHRTSKKDGRKPE